LHQVHASETDTQARAISTYQEIEIPPPRETPQSHWSIVHLVPISVEPKQLSLIFTLHEIYSRRPEETSLPIPVDTEKISVGIPMEWIPDPPTIDPDPPQAESDDEWVTVGKMFAQVQLDSKHGKKMKDS
jgi:hypothetical protein